MKKTFVTLALLSAGVFMASAQTNQQVNPAPAGFPTEQPARTDTAMQQAKSQEAKDASSQTMQSDSANNARNNARQGKGEQWKASSEKRQGAGKRAKASNQGKK